MALTWHIILFTLENSGHTNGSSYSLKDIVQLLILDSQSGCSTLSDSHGNVYDLSHLSRDSDDSPWVAIDTSEQAKKRSFFINVCKPLPPVQGCPGESHAISLCEGQAMSHRLAFTRIKRVLFHPSISIHWCSAFAFDYMHVYSIEECLSVSVRLYTNRWVSCLFIRLYHEGVD